MATMRAIQISKAKGAFELVERAIPEPGISDIRIKVESCGVCHSDMFVKEGLFPGIKYPRIPGHEIIGIIDAVGASVKNFQPGQRVGVGWHGGHCFVCDPCRRGEFIHCAKEQIAGISYDGGYAEYCVVPQEAAALVPDGLDPTNAAPLMCAGVTTYNSLRNSGARSGDVVGIQGVGGLGHLGVQFARAMGFRTVAISGSDSKRELAAKLGAHDYIDTSKQSPAAAMKKWGGAKVILATAPDGKSMSPLIAGLGIGGRLVIVGAGPDPVSVSPLQLIGERKSIAGWPSGTAMDSQDTMNFAALAGIQVMAEKFPLEKAEEAYGHMLANKVRFRAVLVM
jgi:D-arabinose 1-dehydrogenase-like Zn-dependent alcohol dehydrogenase